MVFVVTDLSDPTIYATNNETEYPIGTFWWDFYGDPCYEDYHNQLELNINACSGKS